MDRVFAVSHGTQLLVVQHLRRHLSLPPAREFLIWHPMEGSQFIDSFMKSVIASAGFDGVLDIRDFQSLKPRTQGPLLWAAESIRRLRQDAAATRRWMSLHEIDEADAELWTDDPLHFYVFFTRGLLRRSRHVKIPHCFNFEDSSIPQWKDRLENLWGQVSWTKRFIGSPMKALITGVDLRAERIEYDRAYTFDQPSPWSPNSIDVSNLISMEAFDETYRHLPQPLRADTEAVAASINAGRRPVVLLLLFGLNEELRLAYMKAVTRIFSERSNELANCTLAVKVHPSKFGTDEEKFIDWLRANVRAEVIAVKTALNLEFMLPQLRPDYVWAGPCGALPIVKRLGAGRPIALPEIAEYLERTVPSELENYWDVQRAFEVW